MKILKFGGSSVGTPDRIKTVIEIIKSAYEQSKHLAVVVSAFATLAVTSPYRMARLTSFLNPWATQFDSGYQLTQSLIAFGRGGWFGVGLGDSIQKLFYLPEAVF